MLDGLRYWKHQTVCLDDSTDWLLAPHLVIVSIYIIQHFDSIKLPYLTGRSLSVLSLNEVLSSMT